MNWIDFGFGSGITGILILGTGVIWNKLTEAPGWCTRCECGWCKERLKREYQYCPNCNCSDCWVADGRTEKPTPGVYQYTDDKSGADRVNEYARLGLQGYDQVDALNRPVPDPEEFKRITRRWKMTESMFEIDAKESAKAGLTKVQTLLAWHSADFSRSLELGMLNQSIREKLKEIEEIFIGIIEEA